MQGQACGDLRFAPRVFARRVNCRYDKKFLKKWILGVKLLAQLNDFSATESKKVIPKILRYSFYKFWI
jgi:hypothetical protein